MCTNCVYYDPSYSHEIVDRAVGGETSEILQRTEETEMIGHWERRPVEFDSVIRELVAQEQAGAEQASERLIETDNAEARSEETRGEEPHPQEAETFARRPRGGEEGRAYGPV